MNSKTFKLILPALLALVLNLVAQSAFAEALDLKTGTWETTATTTIQGMPIPKATLAQLSASAREQVEQQMRERAAKPHTQTLRSCVTQDKLNRSDLLQSGHPDCKRKILSQDAHKLEVEERCPPPISSKSHYLLVTKTPDRYDSTIDVRQGESGKIHIEMTGQWISAECNEPTEE